MYNLHLISSAIHSIRPNSKWTLTGDDISKLVWLDEIQSKPTTEEIIEEYDRLQSIMVANEYKSKRAPEYPSIGDQLDALFHAGVFPPEMAAQIQAIKDKYPKPE